MMVMSLLRCNLHSLVVDLLGSECVLQNQHNALYADAFNSVLCASNQPQLSYVACCSLDLPCRHCSAASLPLECGRTRALRA